MPATMIGTARKAPAIPQIAPQKASDRMIPNDESRSVCPSSTGSSTLPMTNCTSVQRPPISRVSVGSPVWASVRTTAITVAMIEPMVGMKFRIKVSMATAPASSSPAARKIIQISSAVARLIADFTSR